MVRHYTKRQELNTTLMVGIRCSCFTNGWFSDRCWQFEGQSEVQPVGRFNLLFWQSRTYNNIKFCLVCYNNYNLTINKETINKEEV